MKSDEKTKKKKAEGNRIFHGFGFSFRVSSCRLDKELLIFKLALRGRINILEEKAG